MWIPNQAMQHMQLTAARRHIAVRMVWCQALWYGRMLSLATSVPKIKCGSLQFHVEGVNSCFCKTGWLLYEAWFCPIHIFR
jgi:hypothetical protein